MLISEQDRLSALLQHFRLEAQLHHSGSLCGINHFDASDGFAYLHILRRGELEVHHPQAQAAEATRCFFDQPTLLFYPRPYTHRFHNPPIEGADFTCARLIFAQGKLHPISQALPPFLAIPLDRLQGLQDTLNLLLAETSQVRCGHQLIIDRLFEILVFQLLRFLLDHPEYGKAPAGLLAGLADPHIALVLNALHNHPERPWSLASMAKCAGMSRTAFIQRFQHCVGQTPADYLASWRISLIQQGLKQGLSSKVLAAQLGYSSPSTLSRSFQAKVGMAPRDWLKHSAAPTQND